MATTPTSESLAISTSPQAPSLVVTPSAGNGFTAPPSLQINSNNGGPSPPATATIVGGNGNPQQQSHSSASTPKSCLAPGLHQQQRAYSGVFLLNNVSNSSNSVNNLSVAALQPPPLLPNKMLSRTSSQSFQLPSFTNLHCLHRVDWAPHYTTTPAVLCATADSLHVLHGQQQHQDDVVGVPLQLRRLLRVSAPGVNVQCAAVLPSTTTSGAVAGDVVVVGAFMSRAPGVPCTLSATVITRAALLGMGNVRLSGAVGGGIGMPGPTTPVAQGDDVWEPGTIELGSTFPVPSTPGTARGSGSTPPGTSPTASTPAGAGTGPPSPFPSSVKPPVGVSVTTQNQTSVVTGNNNVNISSTSSSALTLMPVGMWRIGADVVVVSGSDGDLYAYRVHVIQAPQFNAAASGPSSSGSGPGSTPGSSFPYRPTFASHHHPSAHHHRSAPLATLGRTPLPLCLDAVCLPSPAISLKTEHVEAMGADDDGGTTHRAYVGCLDGSVFIIESRSTEHDQSACSTSNWSVGGCNKMAASTSSTTATVVSTFLLRSAVSGLCVLPSISLSPDHTPTLVALEAAGHAHVREFVTASADNRELVSALLRPLDLPHVFASGVSCVALCPWGAGPGAVVVDILIGTVGGHVVRYDGRYNHSVDTVEIVALAESVTGIVCCDVNSDGVYEVVVSCQRSVVALHFDAKEVVDRVVRSRAVLMSPSPPQHDLEGEMLMESSQEIKDEE
eukprot:PhM_4_TR11435/c0_g1_i1/m.23370